MGTSNIKMSTKEIVATTHHQVELKVLLYEEESGFVAQCLNVNVASEGDPEQDALANIHEALELYFDGRAGSQVPTLSSGPPMSGDLQLFVREIEGHLKLIKKASLPS
jgi:predicted RNase H-like HicB family nuclease